MSNNIDNNNIIVNSNKDVEDMSKEDQDAMNAMIRVPSFEDFYIWQQAKRKPAFKSASLTYGEYDKRMNTCTRCGDASGSHWALECPLSNQALLYSGE